MIKISHSLSPEDFEEKAGRFLEENEAENNLILGIAANLRRRLPPEKPDHYLWLAEDQGKILGAGAWTPPYKMALTRMTESAALASADDLAGRIPFLNGMGGPKETVLRMAEAWGRKTGRIPLREASMRIYELKKIIPRPKAIGKMRAAEPRDLDLLTDWFVNFNREIGALEKIDHRLVAEATIRESRLFIWENPGPVAMAGFAGSTSRGARVNLVYTDPAERHKGYASSLTASLSGMILASGKAFCVLYTDLLNPTSNHIYQEIGYRPVCDWDTFSLERG